MDMKNVKSVIQMSYTDEFEVNDLKERRLFINDEIDSGIIDSIVYHILRYNKEDKGLAIKDRKPIYLFLNSNGGSVVDGYGVIDVMMTSKTPIYTINQASCFSMGFLIFLAGQKRYAMPRSEFLMHDGSTFSWDSMAKAKDRMEFEAVQLEQVTKQYILSRTKIDEKLYDEKYRVEWYMLPEEAKRMGVCTDIIGIDCDIDDIV